MSCSKFPPSLHATALPSGLSEELKAAALVPMDALLLHLLPLRTFAEAVLQQDQRELKSGFLYLHQLCDYWGMSLFFFFLLLLNVCLWTNGSQLHFKIRLALCFIYTCLFSAGLSPEHELPQCLLLVNVLDQLASQPEEVLQLWYAGSQFPEETPR